MSRNKDLDAFIEQLIESFQEEYKKTEEYAYQKKSKAKAEELLETQFNQSDKILIEEILFELLCYTDREANLLYKQGFKDGIWLLKNIGVLA